MNNIDKAYTDLLQDILDNGCPKTDRTGTGTKSVFGRQIRHRMSEGFPLLTTKKMAFKTMVTELLWFLKGSTNIKYLVDNGCHIWNGDALKAYHKHELKEINEFSEKNPSALVDFQYTTQEEFINKIKTDDEFAKKWGELGPIYGKQWRNWEKCELTNDDDFGDDTSWGDWNIKQIDQIANLISELKTNPDSRRLMVNAWNCSDLDSMVLPPCHYGFQVYTRELSLEERVRHYETTLGRLHFIPPTIDTLDKENIPTRAISLMYNTRSQDVPLGTPFNIASYALLLEIIAKEVNMVPDELIANMGDCHIYLNQKDGVVEQLTREPYPLPKLKILDSKVDDISHYEIGDFIIEGYQSHPAIKMPLSN